MSLPDVIIESFRDLGGSRRISEIEDWIVSRYGARWSSSSISTALADMVPRRAGGNPSSLIPEEKRVLSRVARGIYALQTGEGSKLVVKAPPANLSVSSSILDCFVAGSPSPFANPGERGWKDQLRSQVPAATGLGHEKGLTLEFGYGGGGDIDNLCDPVFSVVANEKGWFRGSRSNLEWWVASKHPGQEGCRIRASTGSFPELEHRDTVFEGDYHGTIPKRAVGEQMLEWVKSRYPSSPVDSRVAVEIGFYGVSVNIGEVATGPVKSCVDCLQPVLGGVEGNPDDWRVDRLLVHREKSVKGRPFVRVAVWMVGT